jgi:DNA-binding protein HU-beta
MAIGKSELVNHVASKTDLTKVDAQKAVEGTLEAIASALEKGEEVRLIGFGSFSVQTSAAREGRNPRTGEKINIAASNKPVFKAGKDLKELVNKAPA